jgi:hypothetical protein
MVPAGAALVPTAKTRNHSASRNWLERAQLRIKTGRLTAGKAMKAGYRIAGLSMAPYDLSSIDDGSS